MGLGIVFWMIMLLCLLLGLFNYWRPAAEGQPARPLAFWPIVWILFALLGWAQFGAMIK